MEKSAPRAAPAGAQGRARVAESSGVRGPAVAFAATHWAVHEVSFQGAVHPTRLLLAATSGTNRSGDSFPETPISSEE